VLLSIAKARSAIAVINKDYAEDKPVDPIKIKEIEKHLQTLENNIQHASSVLPPTRLWAAGFYQEMGLVEHLKNLAKSLTKQDMFYNEILRMLSETIIYGPQTYDENNDPDFSKKAHKHKLLEAFDYSLEVQDSKELRKNIAFNFVYGVDNKCAGFPTQSNEPLLDHLEGGKETCLYAIKALRQKVKLQKSSEEKDKKIKQLEAEIAAMKAKQHI
ncbi:MAG TPA: hypothetical protein VFP93_03055, partial [Gammaproteobacteria bacterium]|nr:hypothetical protein [Gammaproteobacteria bacterium]